MIEVCTFKRNGRCSILHEWDCPDDCSFYKTADALQKGRVKAMERILKLTAVEKVYIEERYYQKSGLPKSIDDLETAYRR